MVFQLNGNGGNESFNENESFVVLRFSINIIMDVNCEIRLHFRPPT